MRTEFADSTIRLETARISAKARSAVVSVSTPGVLPTAIPFPAAWATSMLSVPTAKLAIARSFGQASISSASIASVTMERIPSAPS